MPSTRPNATPRNGPLRRRDRTAGCGGSSAASPVVLVLALVAGTLAWRSRQEARAASVSADAQRLAATALTIEQPDLALLAAVEGTRLEQSPETYGALLTLLARQPRVVHRLRTPDQAARIATSPDGAAVFLGSQREPGQCRERADGSGPSGQRTCPRLDSSPPSQSPRTAVGSWSPRWGTGRGGSSGSTRPPGGSTGRCARQSWRPRRPVRRPTSSGAAFAPTAASSPSPAPTCSRSTRRPAGCCRRSRGHSSSTPCSSRSGRTARSAVTACAGATTVSSSTRRTRNGDRPAGRSGAGRLARRLPGARRPRDGDRDGPARRRRSRA